jgi:hypothetical protein
LTIAGYFEQAEREPIMKKIRLREVAVTVMLFTLLAVSPVLAEGFMEGYGGFSFPERTKVKVSSTAFVERDASFGSSIAYGGRGGYWISRLPWLGFAGDLSSLHAKGDKVNIDLTPISLLGMLRAPLLVSDEIPQGELQPYIGIGPSLSLYTYVSADFRPAAVPVSGWTTRDRGFIVPVGVTVQLDRHLAMLVEYRYSYYVIHYDSLGFLGGGDKVDANLASHNLLFGLSWHF